MRKNKMMRTASGLLVATLLTTSVISGTFAKYTTAASGTDSARVAKFGVTITTTGDMFKDEYATDGTGVATAGIITKSVITSGADGDAVVAPGTKGTLTKATIKGKPEVAVRVAYEPELTLTGWKAVDNTNNTTEYCPIVFKVNGETYGLTGMRDAAGNEVTNKSASTAALETAVENAIKAYSKDYAPNTDLSGKTGEYIDVSWEWAFDKNDDAKDTHLGDCAADTDTTNDSKVELSVKTTVTQID